MKSEIGWLFGYNVRANTVDFLKRLFSGKKSGSEMVRVEPARRAHNYERSSFRRPFDYVQAGMQEFEKGNVAQADEFFVRGIHEYRLTNDNFGLWFALGRRGFYLSQAGRTNDAINVLEEAVSLGSDIPASYYDLMGIYADQGRETDLYRVADLYAVRKPDSIESIAENLIGFAITKAATGDYERAARWLTRAEGWAQQHSLLALKYRAWGERGHVVEKSEDIKKSEEIYRSAVDAGSRDRKTYTRLLMILEKQKRFEEATELAHFALGVQSNAAWEEDLRKRLARFEVKSSPKAGGKKKQVPAFSIREGANRLDLIEQIHVTYGARNIALSQDREVLVISKGTSKPGNFIGRRLGNGVEEWTRSFPKSSMPVYPLPDGGYLAIVETGRVGDGSSELYWLNSQGDTSGVATIPDKFTEVGVSNNGVAVGCRDGYLYFYTLTGKLAWKHKAAQSVEIPGPEPYSVPCPYFLDISADGSVIGYSSWDTVTFVSSSRGRAEWTWTAEQNTTSYTLTVPLDRSAASSKYFKVLGVRPGASEQEVQKAFRLRSKETHPDLHPTNPNAADEFREVVAAFEAISSGVAESGGPGHQVTISVTGPASTVYDVVLAREGSSLVTATSDGSVSVIDKTGRVVQRFIAAAGAGRLAANQDLSKIVYSHWEGINFYNRSGLTNTHNIDGLTELFISPSANVVAAIRKKDLYLFEGSGKQIARVESARNITDVVFRDDSEIIIASGKIIRFKISHG